MCAYLRAVLLRLGAHPASAAPVKESKTRVSRHHQKKKEIIHGLDMSKNNLGKNREKKLAIDAQE